MHIGFLGGCAAVAAAHPFRDGVNDRTEPPEGVRTAFPVGGTAGFAPASQSSGLMGGGMVDTRDRVNSSFAGCGGLTLESATAAHGE
jgi:hypothetical protein